MIYQKTYQTGADPNQQKLSAVIYKQRSNSVLEQNGFPPHSHSFYEMDYTIDGTAEWSYVKKKYKLNMPFLVLCYPAKASAFSFNLVKYSSSYRSGERYPQ